MGSIHYLSMFVTGDVFGCCSGEKIEHMLRYWNGDYELLEDNHNYIQWYTIDISVIFF